MTIQERLAKAHEQSVALYLRRQEIERQARDLGSQATMVDLELVRLDGEIRVLTALAQDEAMKDEAARG